MFLENSHLKQINPSSSNNIIYGNQLALGLSDFSIKVENSTIDLRMTIKYKGGNTESFTFSYPFVLEIENSNITSIEFHDSNSYLISIAQSFKTFENEEDYKVFSDSGRMRFIA
jgi:hypothetical protein